MSSPVLLNVESPGAALYAERVMIEAFRQPELRYQLRCWQTEQCLVAPRSLRRHPRFEQSCAQLAEQGWPVLIRQTGGDVTPLGPGILGISMAYAVRDRRPPSIPEVYRILCAPILALLRSYGHSAECRSVPGSFCDGDFNVVSAGRKVAGTAQHWSRVRGDHATQVVFGHALLMIRNPLRPAVDAINQLYHKCALERVVQLDCHHTFATLAGDSSLPLDPTLVAERLQPIYREALRQISR